MSKKSKVSDNQTVKVKGIAGLTAIKVICYILTFPVIIGLSALICFKIADSAPYYGFWPYIPAILMALFGLIFLIVALIVNRKGSKRNALQKTASLLICVVCLTGVFGILMDVVFPDVIKTATSSTLFVEDVYNNYEEQADAIIGYTRQYIRLNLLNGNYDGDLAYETLKADTDVQDKAAEYVANVEDYITWDEDDNYVSGDFKKGLSDLDLELYDWIYTNYVLTDYDYAFAVKAADTSKGIFSNSTTGYCSIERQAFCRALVDTYSKTYAKLCEEGVQTKGMLAVGTTGNAKMSWLFTKNYASMDEDGYLPLNDDAGLAYATSNRMTIPVVLRLILNDHYTITDDATYNAINALVKKDGEDDMKATTINGYFVYGYNKTIADEIIAAHSDIEYVSEGGVSKEMYLASDGNYYYVYEDGHVEGLVKWCVLDMLGEPMAIASIDNPNVLVADLLGGLGLTPALQTMVNSLLSKGLIDNLLIGNADSLLNEDLEAVITEATDGQKIYLALCYNDSGMLEINLIPQAIEQGYLGYQYMTWMESGHLLVTICGVMSVRNLLYIFGAVSIVMIFAIGIINAHIEKAKKAAKDDMANQFNEDVLPVADDAEPIVGEIQA